MSVSLLAPRTWERAPPRDEKHQPEGRTEQGWLQTPGTGSQGRGEAAGDGFRQLFVHGSWRNKKAFHQTFAPSSSSGSLLIIWNGALAGGKPLRCPQHMQAQSGGQSQQILAEGQASISPYLARLGLNLSCVGDLV